jgi:hypothetical protein
MAKRQKTPSEKVVNINLLRQAAMHVLNAAARLESLYGDLQAIGDAGLLSATESAMLPEVRRHFYAAAQIAVRLACQLLHERTTVLTPGQEMTQMDFEELVEGFHEIDKLARSNFWYGPRENQTFIAADLIQAEDFDRLVPEILAYYEKAAGVGQGKKKAPAITKAAKEREPEHAG